MLKLFKKELKLNVPPALYLFSILVFVMLAPNYPIIVGVGYIVMQIFNYLQNVKNNRSQEFSLLLPVKRCDIVTSTTLVIVLFEVINFVLACVCVALCKVIHPNGNLVGIDGNLTFLGIALCCFGLFNLIFLPKYFKTGEKIGAPLLWGLLAFLLCYGVCETVIQLVPVLTQALDGYNSAYLWARIVALCLGIVVYCVSTIVAVKLSVKRFEKVNL